MRGKRFKWIAIVVVVVMSFGIFAGCNQTSQPPTTEKAGNEVGETGGYAEGTESGTESGESSGNEAGENGAGSHAEGAGHEEGGEAGDPASPVLPLDKGWDGIVDGIRVAMSYDQAKGEFSGVVENVSDITLKNVLIELNLKQGNNTVVELGPEPMGNMAPGEQKQVSMLVANEPEAQGVTFDSWQIHPEADNNPKTGIVEIGEEGSELILNGLGINDTYDVTKYGARLILKYDSATQKFIGTVENTTGSPISRARVEVHLDNGTELGPTTPVDLAAGQTINVELDAAGQSFTKWVTHCEVSGAEHPGGGDSGTEGGGEGSESGHDESGESGEGNHNESDNG